MPLDFPHGYRCLMGLKLQRVLDEGWKVEPTLADVFDERLWEHVQFIASRFVTPAHWRAICNSSPQTFWAALHDWSDFAWPTEGPALPTLQAAHVASDITLAEYCEALRESIAQWLHGGTSRRSAYAKAAVLDSISGACGTALWHTLRHRYGPSMTCPERWPRCTPSVTSCDWRQPVSGARPRSLISCGCLVG